tara:strand:+ start:11866 stop:12525 length:660 start_codon:yes stop_codon:yes gene_type:complete
MRVLVAACAATISSVCVHPLDTFYIRHQLKAKTSVKNVWAGCLESAFSSFFTTGMYFTTYEACLNEITGNHRIPVSAFLGTSSSEFISTPLSVYKKRIQVKENNLEETKPLILRQWIHLYFLNVANKFPKSIVKYSIYEPLLVALNLKYSRFISGFLSAFISSLIASVLFEPLEVKRLYTALGMKANYTKIYNGLKFGIISSIIRNSIGHAILEKFAPR